MGKRRIMGRIQMASTRVTSMTTRCTSMFQVNRFAVVSSYNKAENFQRA